MGTLGGDGVCAFFFFLQPCPPAQPNPTLLSSVVLEQVKPPVKIRSGKDFQQVFS